MKQDLKFECFMINMGILSGKISIEELESEIDRVLRGSFYRSDMEKVKEYVENKTSREERKELIKIFKRGLKEAIKGYRKWLKKDDGFQKRDKIYRQKRKEYKTKIKELKKYKRVEIEGVVIDFN